MLPLFLAAMSIFGCIGAGIGGYVGYKKNYHHGK